MLLFLNNYVVLINLYYNSPSIYVFRTTSYIQMDVNLFNHVTKDVDIVVKKIIKIIKWQIISIIKSILMYFGIVFLIPYLYLYITTIK